MIRGYGFESQLSVLRPHFYPKYPHMRGYIAYSFDSADFLTIWTKNGDVWSNEEIEIMENKSKESEFAASIAAAAYAIYSLEETRAEFERRMVESFREDPAALTIKTRKDSQDTNTFEFPDLETLMKRTSLLERRDNNEGNI